MTEVEPVLDFASSGRSGRRNALPDILGSPAGVNPGDLPLKLAELSLKGKPTPALQTLVGNWVPHCQSMKGSLPRVLFQFWQHMFLLLLVFKTWKNDGTHWEQVQCNKRKIHYMHGCQIGDSAPVGASIRAELVVSYQSQSQGYWPWRFCFDFWGKTIRRKTTKKERTKWALQGQWHDATQCQMV